MRKINKGAAIAGGILCFIAIVTIAIDFIQMLSYNAPAQYMIRNGIIQVSTSWPSCCWQWFCSGAKPIFSAALFVLSILSWPCMLSSPISAPF